MDEATRAVLLIGFNRPDKASKVLAAIREAKPTALYFAVDGPRLGNEKDLELVDRVRGLAALVDWRCDLHTRFSEVNQGCRVGVTSAINWFFETEEEGIILEDDCIPDQSFFGFCWSLLMRYRTNQEVAQITGYNCLGGRKIGEHSYYFSRYFEIWGWATWKRAWMEYDLEGRDYPQFLSENVLQNLFPQTSLPGFWKQNLDRVFVDGFDTWDYQWAFSNFCHNRLCIVPNVNLIQNIGHDADATHTKAPDQKVDGNVSASIELDDGPRFLVANYEADVETYRVQWGIDIRSGNVEGQNAPPMRLVDRVKRFLGRIRRTFGSRR